MLNYSDLRVVTDCEVCGNRALPSVLHLGLHPLCDDLVSVSSVQQCAEYPIELLWCDQCFTVHQKFQIPKSTLFPDSYHYRARFTQNVLAGMSDLAESCERKLGSLEGKLVLDIGCNDGSLLNTFRAKGSDTFGIEPTHAYLDAANAGHKITHSFFTKELAKSIASSHGNPHIVTFTNVFAHIENLPQLLESLKPLLGPETVIVIENHYLGSILDKGQFDSFYHEHPRTYSLRSFLYIARSLGLEILDIDFPERYGGNIRVFMGRDTQILKSADSLQTNSHLSYESEFGTRLRDLGERIKPWKEAKTADIHSLVANYGPLSAKSFPGRAAILMKILRLTEREIQCVYERPGSMKIGHYVPGTRIPIVSDNQMSLDLPIILNLAWHISEEVRSYLRDQGFRGKIIDIYSPSEL
jgi:hypothetical protein